MEVKTILTQHQKRFLDEFKKEDNLRKVFYLSGGTALAEFYLKHRESLDLDFFTDRDFELILVTTFMDKVKNKLGVKEMLFETLFDRKIFY